MAEAKIDGLRRHYGVSDHRTLAFKEMHRDLDVEHSGAERVILQRLADSDPEAATTATSEAFWRLVGVPGLGRPRLTGGHSATIRAMLGP